MAAQEAERATEEAQRRAVQQILGVSAPTTGGEQFTRGGAAGVRGVTGGEVGAPITPSAPQARTGAATQSPSALPYNEQQIRAMTVVDRQIASEMRQQNEVAARQQERQETRADRRQTLERSLLDRAAQRVLSAPDQEAQLPQTARALSEELGIPIAEARERLQREMQIAAAPRDREIDALIRGSGIDPNSPQGQETYRALLRRRLEGNAPTVNVAPTDIAGVVEALGAQGVRALAQGELQNTVETATNAISVITLVDQFETAVEAAGGRAVAGVLGELRNAGTGLVGITETLGGLGAEGQRLNEFVNAQVADARASTDQETFNSLFGNPEIGAVQLLGSALNYSNARLRHGAGPLSNQDVERNSVVRGALQSDGQLFAALRAVRRNAEEEYERANTRNESILRDPYNALRVPPLPQRRAQGQPAPDAPASVRPLRDLDSVPLSEWTDAELDAYEGAGGE
jgi:hypothetical protein